MSIPRFISDLAGTFRNQFRITPAGAPGAPTSGSHRTGEIHMDSAAALWVCSVAGTPGTWVSAGANINGQTPLTLASTTYVLDTLDITKYRSAKWVVEFKKGSTYLVLEVVATHDGVNASDMRPVSLELGSGITDVAVVVDISGGNLRLTVSASTTGWTSTWQRIYAMGV